MTRTNIRPLAGRLASRLASVGVLSLAAGLGCATPPPVTAPGLALKKVVIYRNGVGYFERGGRVQSDRVEFRVRNDEVGDFLASLAVLERAAAPSAPRRSRWKFRRKTPTSRSRRRQRRSSRRGRNPRGVPLSD